MVAPAPCMHNSLNNIDFILYSIKVLLWIQMILRIVVSYCLLCALENQITHFAPVIAVRASQEVKNQLVDYSASRVR